MAVGKSNHNDQWNVEGILEVSPDVKENEVSLLIWYINNSPKAVHFNQSIIRIY